MFNMQAQAQAYAEAQAQAQAQAEATQAAVAAQHAQAAAAAQQAQAQLAADATPATMAEQMLLDMLAHMATQNKVLAATMDWQTQLMARLVAQPPTVNIAAPAPTAPAGLATNIAVATLARTPTIAMPKELVTCPKAFDGNPTNLDAFLNSRYLNFAAHQAFYDSDPMHRI